jgi:hypothetical protein
MSKPERRNVLRVFLASPGDLAEERRAARQVVDNLNQNFSAELGWTVDLLGWEDTLPGYKRPQELINKDVDSCDLFQGLLSKRWGESTGRYSSGFEAELEQARRRREQTGEPEIWIAFKSKSSVCPVSITF